MVGYGWLAVVAAVNTVRSIFYCVRVLARSYFESAPGTVPALARTAACVTVASAAALIVGGIMAEVFLRALADASVLIR